MADFEIKLLDGNRKPPSGEKILERYLTLFSKGAPGGEPAAEEKSPEKSEEKNNGKAAPRKKKRGQR
ncbi:MAG: hypothetical protein FJ088_01500 [Deltaproteobacteria bacterium]|nr:hypothetical protein [Deltaproteobacteria bacterium]